MTVTFKRLHATNATTYRNLDVPLDKQGLVLLRADNQDSVGSNGSGKSNIWEMMCHLIFGVTGKGVNKKGMLNQFVGKDMLIDLDLEVDGVPYTFREVRKHTEHGTGFFVYKNNEDITPKRSSGRSEPQLLMQEIIGFSLKEYQGIIYLYQQYNHVLRKGTRGEKQAYLSALFGLDQYDILHKEAKDRAKAVDQEMAEYSSYERDLESCNERLAELPKIVALEAMITAAESALETKKALRKDLTHEVTQLKAASQQAKRKEDALQELADLNFDVISEEELQTKSAALGEELKKVRKSIQSLELITQGLRHRAAIEEQMPDTPTSSTEDLQETVTRLRQEIPQQQALIQQVTEKKELEEKLSVLGAERNKEVPVGELAQKIEETAALVTQLAQELQECDYALRAANDAKASLDAITGSMCPTCHRELEAVERATILEVLAIPTKQAAWDLALEKHTAATTDLKGFRTRKTSLDAIMQEEARILERFVRLPKGDIASTTADLQQNQQDLQTAEGSLTIWGKIETLTEQLKLLPHGSIEDNNVILGDFQGQKTAHETQQSILNKAAVWIRDANLKIEISDDINDEFLSEKQEELTTLTEEVDTLIEQKTHLVNQKQERVAVEKTKSNAEQMLSRASKLRPRQIYLPKLIEAFGPKGLKTVRLNLIMEQIVSIIPHYYGPLFSGTGYTVNVGNDLDFELSMMHEGKKVILPGAGASGGEGKALDMASLFSVRTLRTSTKSANLLIVDEPYGALDAGKRSVLTEQFQQLTETGAVGTVIVIAHEAEVLQHAFDQVWTVVRKNNESTLHI